MASTQQQDRSKLEQDLAALLDYDIDEISDILDNILQSFSIDTSTKDDLLEHMMAWIGTTSADSDGDDGELGLLVENIIRFQKKERLIEREDPNSAVQEEEKITSGVSGDSMKSKKQQERANREIQQKELQRQKEEKRKKEKEDLRRKEIEDRQRRLEQQVQLKNLENDQQKKQQGRSQQKEEKEEEEMMMLERVKALSLQESILQNNSDSIGTQVAKKSTNTKIRGKKQVQKNITKQRPVPPPPIGKAKFVCGCFGTKYKPVTNCLHCGRIICEREWKGGSGPIHCPHCNNLVEKVTMPEEELEKLLSGAKTDEREELKKAILNKQRLLQFDRENTKRTAVFDDQADYYQNSTSNWLTGDERAEAKEQDDKERRELHNRKNPVMKLML